MFKSLFGGRNKAKAKAEALLKAIAEKLGIEDVCDMADIANKIIDEYQAFRDKILKLCPNIDKQLSKGYSGPYSENMPEINRLESDLIERLTEVSKLLLNGNPIAQEMANIKAGRLFNLLKGRDDKTASEAVAAEAEQKECSTEDLLNALLFPVKELGEFLVIEDCEKQREKKGKAKKEVEAGDKDHVSVDEDVENIEPSAEAAAAGSLQAEAAAAGPVEAQVAGESLGLECGVFSYFY
ncbi:MAG: hypothetical protein K0T99_02165 [Alphaproteobacteria bacterium]|nr:hypothetical protein [Alphaproteobacteria bacterium]